MSHSLSQIVFSILHCFTCVLLIVTEDTFVVAVQRLSVLMAILVWPGQAVRMHHCLMTWHWTGYDEPAESGYFAESTNKLLSICCWRFSGNKGVCGYITDTINQKTWIITHTVFFAVCCSNKCNILICQRRLLWVSKSSYGLLLVHMKFIYQLSWKKGHFNYTKKNNYHLLLHIILHYHVTHGSTINITTANYITMCLVC